MGNWVTVFFSTPISGVIIPLRTGRGPSCGGWLLVICIGWDMKTIPYHAQVKTVANATSSNEIVIVGYCRTINFAHVSILWDVAPNYRHKPVYCPFSNFS